MSRDIIRALHRLDQASDGPRRRVEDLDKAFDELTDHQRRVLDAVLRDATDTIERLRRHRRDARRGIIR